MATTGLHDSIEVDLLILLHVAVTVVVVTAADGEVVHRGKNSEIDREIAGMVRVLVPVLVPVRLHPLEEGTMTTTNLAVVVVVVLGQDADGARVGPRRCEGPIIGMRATHAHEI